MLCHPLTILSFIHILTSDNLSPSDRTEIAKLFSESIERVVVKSSYFSDEIHSLLFPLSVPILLYLQSLGLTTLVIKITSYILNSLNLNFNMKSKYFEWIPLLFNESPILHGSPLGHLVNSYFLYSTNLR
jgi:hypothetical protein